MNHEVLRRITIFLQVKKIPNIYNVITHSYQRNNNVHYPNLNAVSTAGLMKNARTHTQLDPQPQTYYKLTYSLNKESPIYIQCDKKKRYE